MPVDGTQRSHKINSNMKPGALTGIGVSGDDCQSVGGMIVRQK